MQLSGEKARENAEIMQERIDALHKEFESIYLRDFCTKSNFDDLSNKGIFREHINFWLHCANAILKPQGRVFIEDESNMSVIKFLIYYFNNCPKALEVFPERNYDLAKNILICGDVGVGKTLIMDAFALYLEKCHNPRVFKSASQTQMLNYYKLCNNLDKFIYNEQKSGSFEGNPYNICVNDLGLQTQKFYGQDTKIIIDEFLFARYEIWSSHGKFLHITTNLDGQDIKQMFSDDYGRLIDRFKMFNVIPMTGASKR